MTDIALRMHRVTAIVGEAQHHPADVIGSYPLAAFSVVKLTAVDDKGAELTLDLFFAERGELGQKIADIYAAALNEAAIKAAALTAVPVETVVEAA